MSPGQGSLSTDSLLEPTKVLVQGTYLGTSRNRNVNKPQLLSTRQGRYTPLNKQISANTFPGGMGQVHLSVWARGKNIQECGGLWAEPWATGWLLGGRGPGARLSVLCSISDGGVGVLRVKTSTAICLECKVCARKQWAGGKAYNLGP